MWTVFTKMSFLSAAKSTRYLSPWAWVHPSLGVVVVFVQDVELEEKVLNLCLFHVLRNFFLFHVPFLFGFCLYLSLFLFEDDAGPYLFQMLSQPALSQERILEQFEPLQACFGLL